MAPAHAAFQVGATLVRRFWIPSVEPKLSSLFAALGTRASRRAILISMRPHRFRPRTGAAGLHAGLLELHTNKRRHDRAHARRVFGCAFHSPPPVSSAGCP